MSIREIQLIFSCERWAIVGSMIWENNQGVIKEIYRKVKNLKNNLGTGLMGWNFEKNLE